MNLRITLLLLTIVTPLAAAPKPVTLVVDDVPVVQVLQALVAQENRNLVVSPDVSGTLSLSLTHVPWRQALQTVIASAGLVMREEGGIFYVNTAAGSANSRSVTHRTGPAGSLRLRCSRKAFRFHTQMPGSCKTQRKNCSVLRAVCLLINAPTGCWSGDNKAVLDTLQRWATQMDIPVEQVELAAHIVTINEKVCGSWGEMESCRGQRSEARLGK